MPVEDPVVTLLGQQTSALSVPVVIASDQPAVPISAASLPLPAGAATEITLAAILAQFNVALSTRASEATLVDAEADLDAILAQLDVALSTRSSEATLGAIGALLAARLDTTLSSRASEATLNAIGGLLGARLDVALSTRASETTLASRASEATLADADANLAAILTRLDVALSTRASQVTAAAILAQLDVPLSTRASEATLATRASEATLLTRATEATLATRASEATLASILARLDVALSTRASQATAAAILGQLDVALSSRASEATLATRATEATLASVLAKLDVALSTRASEATLATRAAAAQLPAALVGGRLDENMGAWLGSTAPTVGQKAMAASVPVVVASDQTAIPISAATLPLPTGAATEATLAEIGIDIDSIEASTANLDVLLSTRASQVTTAAILAQLDVALSTRASEATLATRGTEATLATRATEATLASVLARLDVALSTRASQVTAAAILGQLDVALSTRASEATLATRATEATLATRATEATLATRATAAAQTDGTQKAIARGGAKGATVAADVTSTAIDADHQALDVQLRGSAVTTDNVAAWGGANVTAAAAAADGASNADVTPEVLARNAGYNATGAGGTWDRLRAGLTANVASVLGWLNVLPYARRNDAQAVADGSSAPLLLDAAGGLVTLAKQGLAAALAGAWPMKITDAVNGPAAVKAASVAAVATDPALVVAVSPNTLAQIAAGDSASVDAFGRWRVSDPFTVFDNKQLFDSQPLFWDTALTGAGTSTFQANQSSTALASTTSAGTVIRQSFRRLAYQPGKSQTITLTGQMIREAGTGQANVTRRIGLYDASNGLFFQQSGAASATSNAVVVRTFTSGVAVDTVVAQNAWNMDRLDGAGGTTNPSGVTLDPTKVQIFFIDFQWLGAGRVRFGYVIGGRLIYVHQANDANLGTLVYMQTPNLPIRYELISTGSASAPSMLQICAQVSSEGGHNDTGFTLGIDRTIAGTSTPLVNNASNAATWACLAVRLQAGKTAATIIPKLMSLASDTATVTYRAVLLLNPTLSGALPAFTAVPNSALEFSIPLTASAITVTAEGTKAFAVYVEQNHTDASPQILPSVLQLGVSIAGVSDILVIAFQATPAANMSMLAAFNWGELD